METVLIGTGDPFEVVVDQLARAFGVPPADAPTTDEVQFILGTSWVVIGDDQLDGIPVDEPAYEGVTYELFVRDVEGGDRQIEAARRVYERIVGRTPWKVVLLGADDLPAATRPALEPA